MPAVIEVVNLGINNLSSVLSALGTVTRAPVRVIEDATESDHPSLIVLPGTGAFGAAVERVSSGGFDRLLGEKASDQSCFLVGICLGMQLLARDSEESPGVPGLGFLNATVRRLEPFEGLGGRVPHVGWATLHRAEESHFTGLTDGHLRDVYFSHSYHVTVDDDSCERLEVKAGPRQFTAAVRSGRVSGYQFHPEKSSACGLEVLTEMLRWAGIED